MKGKKEGEKDPKVIKIDDEEYEVVPPQATAATEVIVKMWETLGKPENPFSKAGSKLMEIMISVWRDTWPRESEEWLSLRKDYKDNEMSIKDQVRKGTGRSLASYPYPLYMMMKKVFPKFDPVKRDNAIKFVKHWPIFQMAKKI